MLGTVGKQSVLSFISAYAGLILGILNKIFLFPLIFKENDAYWGMLETFVSWGTIIGALSHFGMPGVLRRFLPGLDVDRDRMIGFTMLISFIGAFLMAMILFFGKSWFVNFFADGHDSILLSEYYFLLIMLVVIMVFFELSTALLISNFKSHIPVFLNSVAFRLGVTLAIAFMYWFKFSLEYFIYIYIGLYLLNLIFSITYLYWRNLFAFKLTLSIGDRKQYLQFGFYALLAGSSAWVINYVDSIFIGKYLGFALVPVLAISKYIISVMYIPARAVVNASVPVISRAWKNNDKPALDSIYKKTAITEIVVGGIIFIAIWINVETIISIIPDDGFDKAKYIILILGLGRLVDLASGCNSSIIANSKYYRFILLSNIVLVLLVIALNVWLTPVYGLMGAAIALALAIFINNISMVIFLWVKERLHPFTKGHLSTMVIFLLAGTLLAQTLNIGFWPDLLLRNFVYLVLVVILLFYFKPVAEITDFSKAVFFRFFKRRKIEKP